MNKPFSPEAGFRDDGAVLFCFSHLRWDFVYQRPQHLLDRASRHYRVIYVEEPIHAHAAAHLSIRFEASGVMVATPVLPHHCDEVQEQRRLIAELTTLLRPSRVVHWFYTPMAQRFTADLPADLVVYDCMDELSAFRFAPPDLPDLERRLIKRADLVFTGGSSLYAAKRDLHPQVHCYPSSVDAAHFGKARGALADPADQAALPLPRIGYFGVIDERMDLDLVAKAGAALPDVQFVLVGPVVKIDARDLPRGPNLHWLGRKEYAELPAYMAHWQAAWMPFALNDATRYISPTKTPEFLAAGLPVTSTAITDVVSDWGNPGLVRIAGHADIAAALRASLAPADPALRQRIDARLAQMSWDTTWASMMRRMEARALLSVAS